MSDLECQNGLTCPYCRKNNCEVDHIIEGSIFDTTQEINCEHCGKMFKARIELTYEYYTGK